MRDLYSERNLVKECHRLANKMLVTATDGNLSIRLRDEILLTPTGRRKDLVAERDLVRIDFSGKVLEGKRATSEWRFHAGIYNMRADVGAICHAHPVYATALIPYIYNADISNLIDAEIRFKNVALVPKLSPGTLELAEHVQSAAQKADIILMASHGIITMAETISLACDQMEAIERYAKTLYLQR